MRRALCAFAMPVVLTLTVVASGPADAADPIVAAVGDISCDPSDAANFNGGNGTATTCHMGQTAALASAWLNGLGPSEAAVLVLGDNQYENGALAKYQGSYALSWGALKALTRPVPGNHEYLTPAAAGYYQYFGAAAGDPSKGWYSYDLGAWHVVALNSNCADIGGCGQGSPQEAWLQTDLAAHPGKCILAYWHHPRFSSGPHGNDSRSDAFWRALYRYGADVVLAGHDHVYERFHRQTPWGALDLEAPKQFTVGTGGKNRTTVSAPAALNSAFATAAFFGVLKLTLHPTSYDWVFVDDTGVAHDPGTTACHLRTSARAADYYTATPCRLVDTRTDQTPLASGAPRRVAVAGACGIPASAVAVSVNVTVVNATGDGSLRLYAASDTVPGTNVVSFRAGSTRAAEAVVPLGELGQLAALASLSAPGANVDLVVDVTGYFVE